MFTQCKMGMYGFVRTLNIQIVVLNNQFHRDRRTRHLHAAVAAYGFQSYVIACVPGPGKTTLYSYSLCILYFCRRLFNTFLFRGQSITNVTQMVDAELLRLLCNISLFSSVIMQYNVTQFHKISLFVFFQYLAISTDIRLGFSCCRIKYSIRYNMIQSLRQLQCNR